MGQADPILTRLGAGPAVKKLVETALALSSSQDPQQRNHAYSFMESAIKELEDGQGNLADPGLGPDVDDDINAPKLREEKDDDERKMHEQDGEDKEDSKLYKKMHEEEDENNEHKVHEEVLDNHNNGPREDGSEQSTDNVAPYPQQGVDTTSGEKPMQDMDDTVNQWSETNGMIVPGLPPIQQNAGMGMPAPSGMPGLDPNIAQEMGMQMPAPPPMDTNQMMRQMQYTIRHEMKNYDRKVVAPMMRHLKAQREALKEQKNVIRKLSVELRETKTTNGNMKLDLDSIRDNAMAKFRETESTIPGFTGMGSEHNTSVAVQPLPHHQRAKVAVARSEIEQMDKILNSNRNPIYS